MPEEILTRKEDLTYASRDVTDFLSEGRFIVLGHKEPDGDCASSQIVMASYLKRLGRETVLLSQGPFDRPEIADFEKYFLKDFKESDIREGDKVIVLDCSTIDRLGNFQYLPGKLPSLVIDHHSSGEPFGNLKIIDPKAPSVTYIVERLIRELGHTLKREEAELLLFGICTDTGFFRHLDDGAVEVLSAVIGLVEVGATLKKAYYMMYGNRELSKRKMLGKMLERAKSYAGNRLIVTYQTIADREAVEGKSRGEDELYMLLQTVRNNEVVAFIREESSTGCSVGLRSRNRIDVGKIARDFGGGGHKLASGFDMDGSIEEVERVVVEKLLPLLKPRY